MSLKYKRRRLTWPALVALVIGLAACGEGTLDSGSGRNLGGAWAGEGGLGGEGVGPQVLPQGGESGGAGGALPPIGGGEGAPDASIGGPADATPAPMPDAELVGPMCGDDICEAPSETCETCLEDCGACPPSCGDGICEAPQETCDACAEDCGACPPVCGDGACDTPQEACDTCPQDCGDCGWPADWAQLENEMVPLVNAQRAQGANCGGQQMPPVGPLTMNPELRVAAQLHSQDMAEQNYFDHTSLDGRSPWQRMSAAGYRGQAGGENIAAGNATAQATFTQWLNSPGHCRNMMSGNFSEIGVGYAFGANSQYRHYWTQTFGR